MFYIHLYPYVKKMRCFVWDKVMCSLGFTFSFDGALTSTQVTDAIQAGTFDIYATGAAQGTWSITFSYF